jgi:hypothetical protein
VCVAVRVDSSSSGIRDGLGAVVEAARRKWGHVRSRGRPKAAIFLGWGGLPLLGGNCGTAIGMGSGWTGGGLRCWSWCRRREGSGGRCAGAECGAGRRATFFLGWGWGLWWHNDGVWAKIRFIFGGLFYGFVGSELAFSTSPRRGLSQKVAILILCTFKCSTNAY